MKKIPKIAVRGKGQKLYAENTSSQQKRYERRCVQGLGTVQSSRRSFPDRKKPPASAKENLNWHRGASG